MCFILLAPVRIIASVTMRCRITKELYCAWQLQKAPWTNRIKQQQKMFKATCSCTVPLWWEQFYWLWGVWFASCVSSLFSQYIFNEIASLVSFQNSHLHLFKIGISQQWARPLLFGQCSSWNYISGSCISKIFHAQWLGEDLKDYNTQSFERICQVWHLHLCN